MKHGIVLRVELEVKIVFEVWFKSVVHGLIFKFVVHGLIFMVNFHKWIYKEPNDDQEINFMSTWHSSADFVSCKIPSCSSFIINIKKL